MESNGASTQAGEKDLLRLAGLDSLSLPKHIAVIMDGNGRWAKRRLLPRVMGHKAGAKAVRVLVEEARRLGVRYLTLFSFSSENWLRPAEEVSALMDLFCSYLRSETKLLLENGIRLRVVGNIARLPLEVRSAMEEALNATSEAKHMDLILAVSYGGRDEIVNAARQVAERAMQGLLVPSELDASLFRCFLYAPDVPDPDLLIRTSDECRISNFLLWQLAYAEIVVSPVLWPDFSANELHRCLKEYAGRKRRFGLTDEQIEVSG